MGQEQCPSYEKKVEGETPILGKYKVSKWATFSSKKFRNNAVL
jgi:hypothetical protein